MITRVYRRAESHPTSKFEVIKYHKQDVFTQKLLIPDYGLHHVPIHEDHAKGSRLRTSTLVSTALKSHIRFRTSISAYLDESSDEIAQSTAEIKAVNLTFPGVHSEPAYVCMAAWLVTLCALDDVTEKLPPLQAKAVLKDLISCVKSPGKSFFKRYKAVNILRMFKKHCSYFLPQNTLKIFLNSICTCLEGLLQEMSSKHDPTSLNLGTYLSIRLRTIGITPLFVLLMELDPQHGGWSEKDLAIQQDLCLAIGLQNDLLGLEKDIKEGNHFNSVIIARAEYDGDLQKAVKYISDMHNSAVSRALSLLGESAQGHASASEAAFQNAQVSFIQGHFHWGSNVSRYKVSPS